MTSQNSAYIEIVETLVEVLGAAAVNDLTNALQPEEIERWLDGLHPMKMERERLSLVHSMLTESRQKGIRDKTFKNWMTKSKTIRDAEHGYDISPCRALKQRMVRDVTEAFQRFITGI